MNKIKQQILQLRKTTPKHIQWLLLGAAFVVVLMLLTILIGGEKNNTDLGDNATAAALVFDPDIKSLDWAATTVGEKQTQTIKISATVPTRILDVHHDMDVPGLSYKQQTCTTIAQIDATTACTIIIEYAPDAAMTTRDVPMFIDWRATNEPDDMKKTETVTLSLGAVAPAPVEKPVAKPEPKPEPKPIVTPEPVYEPLPEPTTTRAEIRREIEQIAPAPLPEPAPTPRATACSDFAIPGYNMSGVQSGWIKPMGGAYYYHPFSDKNCDSPTGIYNPDNGIITDIDDASKKIGTDAEHIGYKTITATGTIPQLSNAPGTRTVNRARQLSSDELATAPAAGTGMASVMKTAPEPDKDYLSSDPNVLVNSIAHDRRFVLRQYKPIPATIVSDIRADPEALGTGIPVRATVDRNVYADNGRTIIIPTGTLLMGYVYGELPGPYKAVGRMDIKWYQFVLPNGVEFNFADKEAFSGDAQGRSGVPGHGSTDYIEQFFMPMLTAIVPAAVNMIAPISDKFVNQIDLDNNTVVQSGTVRSSELAKNEIITAWNQVAQKLLVDMIDNTVPPFSIAAGTRITVYSPVDLMVTCGDPTKNPDKACAVKPYNPDKRKATVEHNTTKANDGSWVGQVRSFNMSTYCTKDKNGNFTADESCATTDCGGYDYRTILFYCQSLNYKAINNAKQEALFQNQQDSSNTNSIASTGGVGTKTYNEQVLGLTYDTETGAIENPFQSAKGDEAAGAALLLCDDGIAPDANGCCTGEIYTDMGEQGFNCCPSTGGDCFPPLI